MTALLPSTGELRVFGVVLLVLAAFFAYVIVEFLWHNRGGRK